jgi:hypothetical protein
VGTAGAGGRCSSNGGRGGDRNNGNSSGRVAPAAASVVGCTAAGLSSDTACTAFTSKALLATAVCLAAVEQQQQQAVCLQLSSCSWCCQQEHVQRRINRGAACAAQGLCAALRIYTMVFQPFACTPSYSCVSAMLLCCAVMCCRLCLVPATRPSGCGTPWESASTPSASQRATLVSHPCHITHQPYVIMTCLHRA